MKLTKEEILNVLKESPFIRSNYKVNISLTSLVESLGHFVDNYRIVNLDELMEKIVPDFQRNNDKWTEEMQVAYVENVIKGFTHETVLFTYENIYSKMSYSRCWVLDGLQRLTAIVKFIKGELLIFGGYSYNEIREVINLKSNGIFDGAVRIYKFDNEIDAVKFYININENITHSKEDIQKARNYLNALKNETIETYNIEHIIKDKFKLVFVKNAKFDYRIKLYINNVHVINYFCYDGLATEEITLIKNKIEEFINSTRLRLENKIIAEIKQIIYSTYEFAER